MLFFKRCFVTLGSILHIFLDHRKSQESSKNLKKPQKQISKSFQFAGKNKKQEKNK